MFHVGDGDQAMAMTRGARTLVYCSVLYWQAREVPLLEGCVRSLLAQAALPDSGASGVLVRDFGRSRLGASRLGASDSGALLRGAGRGGGTSAGSDGGHDGGGGGGTGAGCAGRADGGGGAGAALSGSRAAPGPAVVEDFEVRVLLIDNGSGLDPDLGSESVSALEMLRLPRNLGFAGGHNAGLRYAFERGAEFVLLFNSDAIAEPGCLAALISAARAKPMAALLGPVLVRAAPPGRIESAGQSFNRLTARHRELDRDLLVRDREQGFPSASAVDALSGCALLARRSAVEAIGPLDEGLFAYFEDMEWCLRARKAGFDVVLVPDARVRHIGQASTGRASTLSTYYSVRNHMRVAARHAYAGRLVLPLVLVYHLAYVLRSPERRTRRHLAALMRGALAAMRGQLGPAPVDFQA